VVLSSAQISPAKFAKYFSLSIMILALKRSVVNDAEFLAASAMEEFRRSEYPEIRGLMCQAENGEVVIVGKVPSFYHKQLAQTWLIQRGADEVKIENRLEIAEAKNNEDFEYRQIPPQV
jgi:hypothetical protein